MPCARAGGRSSSTIPFSAGAAWEGNPDPQAACTFHSAKLDWAERDNPVHREMLDWSKRILAVRRERLAPLIPSMIRGGTFEVVGPLAVTVTWQAGDRHLQLDANLKAEPQDGFTPAQGDLLLTDATAGPDMLGPWTVRWSLLDPA